MSEKTGMNSGYYEEETVDTKVMMIAVMFIEVWNWRNL